MELIELWQTTLGELEIEISPPNFHTWFKNTGLQAIEEGVAKIAVPSAFVKKWLGDKYQKAIVSTLRKHEPTVSAIDFVIHGNPAPLLQPIRLVQDQSGSITFTINGRLKPEYTFENFVVGQSNRFAYAAAKTVAENPGKVHNPLFIYGGVGLGKTHLISAIGNAILRRSPKIKISYLSCEDFANEFIQALQGKTIDSFKQRYRNVDVFLVDDIQFLARKEGTQEEFFHTFNALHQANRQIVMTADRMPKAIPDLENRLSSRFGMGMVADIQQPNLETRQAILLAKCAERGIELNEEIINHVAQHIKSNIRELEGALNRIIGYCQLNNLDITLENAIKAIESFVDQNQVQIAPDRIIESVSQFFGVRKEDVLGKKRSKELVYPRHITMYLLRHEIGLSYPNIGKLLGGKDHTTVIHGCTIINRELSRSENLRSEITHLKELITAVG